MAAMATRLRVDESALRKSVDDLLPDPATEVLVAVVREFGVDPTWLLTGEYAPATHQRALESDDDGLVVLLRDLVRREPPARGIPISDATFAPDFTRETRADGG